MYLYNYSPIHGLSAGMCFTIVGAAYIPDYLMRVFGETLKKVSENIAKASEGARVKLISLSEVSQGFKNFKEIDEELELEIKTTEVAVMNFNKSCKKLLLKYDIGVLQKLLKSTITALFYYYSLFFNGSILIVGGYERDEIFTRFDAKDFLFILDVLGAIFLFLLSILNSTRGYKSFIASIITFFITMVLVSSLMNKNLCPAGCLKQTEGIIITISFLVLPYSLFLLVVKIFWWMFITPCLFNRKHRELLGSVKNLERRVTMFIAHQYTLK